MADTRTAARKQDIFAATRALLVELGGQGLTMRKVADRTGISLGNLQYHYSNREVLLQALLNSFLAEYEAGMAEIGARPSGDLEGDLKKLLLAIFSDPGIEACGVIFKELWAEAQHHPEMKEAMAAYYKRLSSHYADLFSELAGVPSRAPEVGRAVSVIVPLLEGYCITGNVSKTSDSKLAKDWARMISSVLSDKV